MAPKKKSKTTSKKNPVKAVEADGLSTQELSREQLEQQIIELREELDRDRRELDYFQLERDKIHTFWEITKERLVESEDTKRIKDIEIDEATEASHEQIKRAKKKFMMMLHEHNQQLAQVKEEAVAAAKLMEKEQMELESELRKDVNKLKAELKQQQLSYETLIKNIKLEHDEGISNTRNEFETKLQEIKAAYETRMQMQEKEQELRHKTEIHETEKMMSFHRNKLTNNHEKVLSDMKNYYHGISTQSVNKINALKAEASDLNMKKLRLEQELSEAQQQGESLQEPLQILLEEVSTLKKKLRHYEGDKASLALTNKRLKVADKELKDLKSELQLLEHKYNKAQQERDELQQKLSTVTQEVQQKSSFKNVLLERKVAALTDTLEKKEAQLYEVLAASNLNPSAQNVITRQLEEVMDSKTAVIKDLQYELARTRKAHDDLLRTCKAKLKACGIPTNQLDFKPLESSAPHTAAPGVLKRQSHGNIIVLDLQKAQGCGAERVSQIKLPWTQKPKCPPSQRIQENRQGRWKQVEEVDFCKNAVVSFSHRQQRQ